MKTKKISFLLFLIVTAFLLNGCKKSSSSGASSGKLISLTIPAGHYYNYDYVNYFVSSTDGSLIYSEDISNDEEVVFEADKESSSQTRFDLSRCFVKNYGNYVSITLTSYIGIVPFSEEFTTSTGTFSGYAYVTFSDVPTYTSYLLANALSNMTTSSGDLSSTTFSIPLYSDLPKGLLIRLNTGSSELYKFVDNLVLNQTTDISLSSMSSDFTTANLSMNTVTPGSLNLTIDKYSQNDFSSGSYSIISSSVTEPISFTYPTSFLPNHYIRTHLSNSFNNGYSSTNHYSATIPASMELLNGNVTFNWNFPESVSYSTSLNDQFDVVMFTWYHSADFIDANGFRLTWNIYVSPSVTNFKLPDIPDEIMYYLSAYGIYTLQFDELLSGYSYISEYGRCDDYDDFMNYYWSGWDDPFLNESDKFYSNWLGSKKGDYRPYQIVRFPDSYKSEMLNNK